MTHAQKPDFVFRRNGSPFKSAGASVQSTAGSRGVRISGSNAGYTMLRGSVKGTGYPLHSSVSPSFLLPCVTVCHHISTGLNIRCVLSFWKCNPILNIEVKPRRPKGEVEVWLYSFLNLGTRWGWVVNATPRLLYPQEGLCTLLEHWKYDNKRCFIAQPVLLIDRQKQSHYRPGQAQRVPAS